MLDPKLLTENPDFIREAIRRKNSPVDLDALLKIDADWREKTTRVDELRAERNLAAKNRDIEAGKKIGAELKNLEPELAELAAAREKLLLAIPNRPEPEVPDGADDSENKIVETVGAPREFDFEPRDHVELGEITDTIELRVARDKAAGERFYYLKNELPLVEYALQTWVWHKLIKKGFTPLTTPMMIRGEAFARARKVPGGVERIEEGHEFFRLADDPLFLIGTSEHITLNLHADQTLDEKDLPLRYAAWSSCFRREVGAAGKDTKGIFRVRQFEKLEQLVFTTREKAAEEHARLVATEKEIFSELGISFQVVECCTGDMGFSDARQFDLEAWFPGQGRHREVTSASNCTDFQARALGTKVKRADGSKELVATLNGTAISMCRALVAIMENFQNADGSISIPEVLWPFLPDGMTKIPARKNG